VEPSTIETGEHADIHAKEGHHEVPPVVAREADAKRQDGDGGDIGGHDQWFIPGDPSPFKWSDLY